MKIILLPFIKYNHTLSPSLHNHFWPANFSGNHLQPTTFPGDHFRSATFPTTFSSKISLLWKNSEILLLLKFHFQPTPLPPPPHNHFQPATTSVRRLFPAKFHYFEIIVKFITSQISLISQKWMKLTTSQIEFH